MGVAVGHIDMTEDQLLANIMVRSARCPLALTRVQLSINLCVATRLGSSDAAWPRLAPQEALAERRQPSKVALAASSYTDSVADIKTTMGKPQRVF